MKHPTGYARPRRAAVPKKKVRLDLKRRPQPAADEEFGLEQKSPFWKWVGVVAVLHVVVIVTLFLIYEHAAPAKPPDQFISLLPEGNLVKGTPGAQKAHKVGATTPAPAKHSASAPPVAPATKAAIKPVTPPPPTVQPLRPTPLVQSKPIIQPAPPKPPKVKVDLTLADAPATAADKSKPKPHHKKPVVKPVDDSEDEDQPATKSESTGLSREQIAAKLGDKLDAAGTKNAVNSGASGAVNSHPNRFSDFYDLIREQINEQWQIPNVAAEITSNPLVHIYVEKDGRVSPESVYLVRSSGNSAYDDSAVSTAKNLGYLHEPLPDGCPPDISIDFKPDR